MKRTKNPVKQFLEDLGIEAKEETIKKEKKQKTVIDLKDNRVEHWLRVIDGMINLHRYRWARYTLSGIRDTIQESGQVTDEQIQAIRDIKWGEDNSFNSF